MPLRAWGRRQGSLQQWRAAAAGGVDKQDASSPSPRSPADAPDFWENPAFDGLGQALQFAVPVLAAAALAVGLFAAKTYNGNATAYLVSARGEEAPAIIVPAASE